MKLMYDLPKADEEAFLAASESGEKRMYCLPFDILEDEFVKGFMMFTDKSVYKLLDGKLLFKYDYSELSDFSTEMMYGSVGFYAKRNGNTELLCRFISGKNLPRYSVVVGGCEALSDAAKHKKPTPEALESNEPERYCPNCGRPFLLHTQICPFCRNNKAMTVAYTAVILILFVTEGLLNGLDNLGCFLTADITC